MLAQILGSVFARNLALAELFHHLGMLKAFGLVQILAVLDKKHVRRCEGYSFIAVNKWMVARDPFGIAGRELESVLLAIGVEVLGTGQSGFQKGGFPQPV